MAVCPYDENFRPVPIEKYPATKQFLSPFRPVLESVITFGQTKVEAGRKWFEYFCPYEDRHSIQATIAFPDITTHNHFVFFEKHRLFKDTAPMVLLKNAEDGHFLTAFLNSSCVLFWLKQICFNKGSGEDEQRDRFEFASGKVRAIAHSIAGIRGVARQVALAGRAIDRVVSCMLGTRAGVAFAGVAEVIRAIR